MKILIVGSKGMLGTDLVKEYAGRHSVHALDLPDLDIAMPEQCRSAVEAGRPDIVVNAAALTDVDYCESHREEAFRVNAAGAGNLAEAAAQAGAAFVHYSTDYVFDGQRPEPYEEEHPPHPVSVYGMSKLKGEELVRSACPAHLIVRTSWLFGPHGRNFIRTIVAAARNGGPLRVVHDQRGSPTYTKDLASWTRMLCERGCRGIYHVTNDGVCSWYDLASSAVRWAGMEEVEVAPVTTAEFPRPAQRPANSALANARLRKEGLPTMRDWKAATKEYVETCLAG